MIRKKIYILLTVALAGLSFASCDDYLDELPDKRMVLKNTDEVSKLLVSAYATSNPAFLLEMYSDNADCYDNTAWSEADKFQSQAYHWEDITEIGDDEAPQNLWDGYYSAIASSNEAIAYITGLSEKDQEEYSQQLGEAYLCRAFNMFVLSTVFCNAYDPSTASKDLGLPYPEQPETKIGVTYVRGTLDELYQKIDADLQKGLKLVGNEYDNPKFHFTPNAALAFATRFYLNYQKYDEAINYASQLLGDNPAAKLRDWQAWNALSANKQVQPNAFVNSGEKSNLLLQTVYSQWGAINGPYIYGDRYAHGRPISQAETIQSEGPWGKSETVFGYNVWYNNALSKYMIRKVPYSIEYTDLQAGIGYAHAEYAVFTTDIALLERAEAYALSGQYDKAVADINSELEAFSVGGVQLTLDDIKAYYKGIEYYTPENPTPKKALHPKFAIESETQEPLLQCILHLKRIVTVHEGFRLQDVKRYGIEMYRRTFNTSFELTDVTDSMPAGDPRLAIQLPQDVINVGLEANPRNK